MAVVCVGQSAYDIVIPYDGGADRESEVPCQRPAGMRGRPCHECGLSLCPVGRGNCSHQPYRGRWCGKKLKKILREAGVDTAHLVEEDGIETPYSIILSNTGNGARTIFNFPGEIRYRAVYLIPELM